MMRPGYSSQLLHCFFNMTHAGELNGINVAMAEYGAALNSEVIQLFLSIENNGISQARFKAYGSPALLGGAEYLCCWLESHTLEQATCLHAHQLLADLELPPVKVHVVSMLEKVLKKCLESLQETR